MNLRTLSDVEFLRHAHNQLDDLTSSDTERELLRRFEATDTDTFEAATELGFSGEDLRRLFEAFGTDSIDAVVALIAAVRRADYSLEHAGEFLNILDDAHVCEPDALRGTLEALTAFRSLANDAGDIFTRLSSLTEDLTQE